jgi:plasmid stabilization system protein ParE
VYRWYETERPGLGAEFRDELWRLLELLLITPELGHIAHRDLRRALTRRFPYAVYYRITEQVIEIRACLHQRRDPRIGVRRA